jgi:hypothetical protein
MNNPEDKQTLRVLHLEDAPFDRELIVEALERITFFPLAMISI